MLFEELECVIVIIEEFVSLVCQVNLIVLTERLMEVITEASEEHR